MKQVLATCSILLLTVLTLGAQEHSAWTRLSSEPGHFSVLMPELANEQSETKPSANGPYTTHLFRVKTTEGLFIVGWVDYDEAFSFGVQSELEANRDNFVKGVKGTLLSTTKITLKGNPGIEFTADTPEVIFKSRVYIIGRRPYQLISGTFKGQDNTHDVSRFFDSFQLSVP